MGLTHRPWLASLEPWRSTLLILGGGGVVTHAGLMGVRAFTTLATPPDVFVATGHLVALVGLLGLVPGLIDRSPRLTRLGAGVAAVAVVSWTVTTVGKLLVVAGVWSTLEAALPGAFFLAVLGTSILAYGFLGVAMLRHGRESRVDGLLVLAPGGLIAVLLVDSVVTGLTTLDGLVIGGALGLAIVALGVRLRSWPERTGRSSFADVAAG